MMDDCFGRILDALDKLGLADHTLVIFTTDHGEMTGQHHMITKAISNFYDDVMHIPLLMRLPSKIPAHKVCDASASSVDLAPTILDYVGAAPLAKAQGRSLRPFVEGTADDDRPAFGERERLDSPRPPSRMIRTRQWKLSVIGTKMLELYDLQHDPGETRNLASDPDRAHVIRELARKLRAHMHEIGDQGVEKLDATLAQLGEKP
jgi:arylsulfatase A-like enzyme